MTTAGATSIGPVEQWPWGQQPGTWMLDPSGRLAGPLGNPQGWIAAHRSNIDNGVSLTLTRVDGPTADPF